jgi:ribosomal protein S18 acetylase RimI-like enzyme
MEIRYAQRGELLEAAALVNESWRWAYKNIIDAQYLANSSLEARHKRFLKGYDGGRRSLLLFDGGALLGFCGFGKSITPGYPDDGEVSAIYLREDAVGRGYGHALMTRAEEELHAQGYQNLVLDVLSQNTRAIKFYLAHGYVKVGDRVHTWGEREYPLDIMRKSAF